MFFNLTESPWIRAGRQYSVRVSLKHTTLQFMLTRPRRQDLWSHTDNGTAVRNVSVPSVPAHGVVALLLRDAGDEPAGIEPPCAVAEWCMDKNGTLL
jgi:alpha-galactosidase